jgi:hypothetical protein
MSHLPYQSWLYDDENQLSNPQKQALHQHLQECPDCQKSAHAWQAVKHQMRTSPQVAPRSGFTSRWQASLAQRRAKEQRRQALRLFILLAGASVVALILLGAVIFQTTSLSSLLVTIFALATRIVIVGGQVQSFIMNWLEVLPPVVSIVAWMMLSGSFCMLVLVWFVSIWRISTHGVFTHETME